MFRNDFSAPYATLFQLLAELEGYELHVAGLARESNAGRELVVFGAAGRAMDRMRALAGGLPALSAHWLMVMISHTELMHNLWRVSQGESLDVAGEVRDHLACVSAMAGRCRGLLPQGGRVLH